MRGRGHEDAAALFYGGEDFWAMGCLVEMRGADFFLAFGYKDEIDGELAACAVNGVQCGEESGFGAFLVYGATADDYLAEAGLVDQRGVPRGRGPFGGIELLYVVHGVGCNAF